MIQVGQIIVPMEGKMVKQPKITKGQEEDAEEEELKLKPPTREEDFQRQVGF